jgi:hypothetical protein
MYPEEATAQENIAITRAIPAEPVAAEIVPTELVSTEEVTVTPPESTGQKGESVMRSEFDFVHISDPLARLHNHTGDQPEPRAMV